MSGTPQTRLRRWLLALLVLGMTAVGVDLWLLEHFEEWRQWLPLIAVPVSLLGVGWFAFAPGRWSRRTLRLLMLAWLLLGAVGVYLHFQGNLEFQLEIDPSQPSWDRFWAVMRAKAPPALAPGAMAQLGLLGFIIAWIPWGEPGSKS